MPRRITATYLQFAKECIDMAERADPRDRRRLQLIAAMWLKLATDELGEASLKSKRPAAVRASHRPH